MPLPNISLRAIPATFVSDRPLDECIDRLAARVDDFTAAAKPSHERRVTGVVDGDRVRLRVVTPFTQNVFARTFHGRFVTQGGKSVLKGRFAVDPLISAGVGVWLFVIGFSGIVFLADLFIGSQSFDVRAGMAGFWLLLVLLYVYVMGHANRWAESDIGLMRGEIESALD